MNQEKNIKKTIKKICVTTVVIAMILGVLTSAFGVTVLAMNNSKQQSADASEVSSDESAKKTADTPDSPASPLEGYDYSNEISMNDRVKVLSEKDTSTLNAAVKSTEVEESYYDGKYMRVTLAGENRPELANVGDDDILYLQGDSDMGLGGEQFIKVLNVSSYNKETVLDVTTPSFEEVFDSMQVAISEPLTEDNLVSATYADGVSAHFGNVEDEITDLSNTKSLEDTQAQALAPPTQIKPTPMLSDTSAPAEGIDLIIDIDYTLGETESKSTKTKSSFGVKGSFGVKDLAAHFICDMPSVTDINDLYYGVSGEQFVDIDFYGKLKGDFDEDEVKSKKKKLIEISGLDNKRVPLAVFQFAGIKPVYISNKAFEKARKAIVPTFYVVLYLDWEGEISLEFNAGFECKRTFNNGLRIAKNGEPHLAFEEYPYVSAYGKEPSFDIVLDGSLTLSANVEVTLPGCSLLFYVAGINFGEISIARFGVQAEGTVSVSGDTKDGFKVADPEDTSFYIRGFFNLIEVKVNLKIEGNKILDGLDAELKYNFVLLSHTFFEWGHRPDKYRPTVPVSSMETPSEYESVISLVCDVSGSMNEQIDTGETKLEALQQAGKSIISMTEGWAENNSGNYGLGIVQFDDYAEAVSVPHIDYAYLNDCFDTIGRGGGTDIVDGLDSGISQLESVEAETRAIVLLTDGQHNGGGDPVEQAEIAKEKGITIYTIGFGDGVSEELLREIAETTGGEYKFASTDGVIGIIGGFMYAQQSTNATVISEDQGTVAQDETTEPSTFKVEDEDGNLMVSTAWPGSFLETILTDPQGRRVDKEYPDVVIDESKIPSSIIVKNPIPGKWSVQIKGVETSYEHEPYYTIVSFKESKNAKINVPLGTLAVVASYCIPIGAFVFLANALLLIWLLKKKPGEKKTA